MVKKIKPLLIFPAILSVASVTSCSNKINDIEYLEISEKGYALKGVLQQISPLYKSPRIFNDYVLECRGNSPQSYAFNFENDDSAIEHLRDVNKNGGICCENVEVYKKYEYDTGNNTTLSSPLYSYVYSLSNGEEYDKIIFYIHGGGYLQDIIAEELSLADNIAYGCNAKVYIPIYPLAPYDCYATAYEFMCQAYEDISKEAKNNNKEIIVMGDSAGGGFAIGILQYLNLNKTSDLWKKPKGLVLLSPWLDVTMSNPDCLKMEEANIDCLLGIYGMKEAGHFWARTTNFKDYRISPLYGDLSILPETLTICGDSELMYPDNMLFYNKLNRLNIKQKLVIGKGLMHDFAMYNNWQVTGEMADYVILPEAAQAQQIIINFIDNIINN